MNTNRTGMRTVLAAAAAGALILGSAAGAMAADPVNPTPTPVMKIQTVDIHRHSPINIDTAKKARDLKLRVTIRDTDAASVTSVKVTLTQFASKRKADPVANPIVLEATLTSPKANKAGTAFYFKGAVLEQELMDLAKGVDPQKLEDGESALMCISAVTPTYSATPSVPLTWSKQTMKRLGLEGVKKPVRECVKIYNPKAKPAKPAKNS